MVETARRFDCIAVILLPAMTPLAIRLLDGDTRVAAGGVAGFPSGGETTATKVFQARMIATTITRTCSPREERDGGSEGWGPGEG